MGANKHILLIVKIEVAPEMEDELNRWYDEEHIPNLLKVPGVLWAKRGVNQDDGIKYCAVYEHESIEIQHTKAYLEAIDTEWSRKIRPFFIKVDRVIYQLL